MENPNHKTYALVWALDKYNKPRLLCPLLEIILLFLILNSGATDNDCKNG